MQETEVLHAPGGRLSQAQYGSDLAVELFAALEIPYVALNPGSSYRGLHDSFVNFDAAGKPQIIVCCHEEIAVAVAHGYARATGKPMLAALHNVVGLQHATMAIYNAWCDRVPVIVIGGTGPMAAENRRNHIDWVHTANVQGNIVRDIVKWDDQPASVFSFTESIMRGYRIAMTEPRGPVYLCFDVDLQEQPVTSPMMLPDVSKLRPPTPIGPDPDALREAAAMVAGAQFPVILAGSIGRYPETLPAFQELVDLLQAPVFSMGGYSLPSNHPLLCSAANRSQFLEQADVLLAIDIFDLASALSPGTSPVLDNHEYIRPDTKVININLWDLMQHSLISDYERLHEADLPIASDSRIAVPMLLEFCRQAIERDAASRPRIEDRSLAIQRIQDSIRERREEGGRRGWDSKPISMERVSYELSEVVKSRGIPWTALGGRGPGWEVTDPIQVISGGSGHGGGGLGEASGSAVGAALGRPGRFCFTAIGDGNLLYTPSALWTASNQKLPLLYIVNNNFAYGNDEAHQEHMALERGRPVENKGIGIYIDDPRTDFTRLAEAFNVEGIGPIIEPEGLRPAMERAVDAAMENRPVLVDVHSARGREGRANRG